MQKISLYILLLFSALLVQGQSIENFRDLRSSGTMPADFTILSSTKYKQDYEQNLDKKLDQEFFLNTRFFIDELLLSGKVLFNDPLSIYVAKVAKVILSEEEQLFNSLRFYTIRSTVSNAFSTDQGIIFVTTGLLSQLENEAQLAFILAHEISHYTEKHVQEGYLERKKIESDAKYSRISYDNALKNLSKYSKESEIQADIIGLDLYLETDYDIAQVYKTFDVLLYSYLPFDEVRFDSNYFNTEILKIPGIYFRNKKTEITAKDDQDDKFSTHPNIQTRVSKVKEFLDSEEEKTNTKQFIVSESDFYYVRTLARFESINLHLTSRMYSEALYEIYILEREFPSNRFLDLAKVKSLYALVKYKNRGRFDEVTSLPVEGESSMLIHFLKKINKQQLNVIALRNVYDITQKYESDTVFFDYLNDLKKEFALNSGVNPKDLSAINYEQYLAENGNKLITFNIYDSIEKVEQSTSLSKTEKIELKDRLLNLESKSEVANFDVDFLLFALHDLVANENLVDDLLSYKDSANSLGNNVQVFPSRQTTKQKTELSIKNLVVVDPIYESYGSKENRNLVKSEKKKINVTNYFNGDYGKLDMQTTVLNSKGFDAAQTDTYNEISLIYEWLIEVLYHRDLDMINSSNDRMNALIKKYNTPHFLFTAISTHKGKSNRHFEMVAIAVNAETDQIEFAQGQYVHLKAFDTIIEAYIYNLLYQLNSGKQY